VTFNINFNYRLKIHPIRYMSKTELQ